LSDRINFHPHLHLLRVFAGTPGFSINAGCAIPAKTPAASLRAMIAAARS
jgi:uroporphyrinogen-III decarboxylase